MIYNVLHSYAQREHGGWRLRDEDAPSQRREELKQMAGWSRSLARGWAMSRAGTAPR